MEHPRRGVQRPYELRYQGALRVRACRHSGATLSPMPALQPPTKKIGTVWYVKDESGKPARRWPSGRVRYRGKVTWPDGKRQDVAVPEAHCRTDDTANEHIKGLQEQLTKTGTLALAQVLAIAA